MRQLQNPKTSPQGEARLPVKIGFYMIGRNNILYAKPNKELWITIPWNGEIGYMNSGLFLWELYYQPTICCIFRSTTTHTPNNVRNHTCEL